MKKIIEILNSHFTILQIVIENFTLLNSSLEIHIEINSIDLGTQTIIFQNVSGIDINSEKYSCSDKSSIVVEDLSRAQIEGIKYKIAISEDAMTFYCKEIILSN